MRRDHPRSRGVYRLPDRYKYLTKGSSPLARGLQRGENTRHAQVRIIPARAGFTRSTRGRRRSSRDHPRSRGVYWSGPFSVGRGLGSSPLARGLRRVVPAFSPIPSDHPRSRGVYLLFSIHTYFLSGSSPLARGLPPPTYYATRTTRIIPARAGFTRQAVSTPPSASGSSPLARGLPHALSIVNMQYRIIPARAGFTHRRLGGAPARPDHPRSRGVYCPLTHPHRASTGSSPLARGLQRVSRPRRGDLRIIPARAGFTSLSSLFSISI